MHGVSTNDSAAIGGMIARVPCVVTAWVFGSVARGAARSTSDLDVGVLLAASATAEDREALRALSLHLEKYAPSGRVDLVVLGEQGPVFRHSVIRDGVLVLDRDPQVRKAFEAATIAEYLDWKPTHDLAMEVSLEGIRRRLAGGSR